MCIYIYIYDISSLSVNRNIKQRSEMGGTCVTFMTLLEMVYVNLEIL